MNQDANGERPKVVEPQRRQRKPVEPAQLTMRDVHELVGAQALRIMQLERTLERVNGGRG